MADKSAYHPDGKHTIRFRESNHSYIDNYGSRYTSGTTFIKPFFPKFDAVAVSIKCSKGINPKYAGRDPKEIREEWKKEGQRGSREGDNVHEYAEGLMSGWTPPRLPSPISERCSTLFKQVDKITTWLQQRFEFIEAEKVIFSPSLGIAGMIDLLMFDPAPREIILLDWKQNKDPLSTENFYQSGLHPIDHLQYTKINEYTLQLSLYQHILQREHYFPQACGFRRALIHITPAAAIPIKLDFYDYEIKEMLKCQNRMTN